MKNILRISGRSRKAPNRSLLCPIGGIPSRTFSANSSLTDIPISQELPGIPHLQPARDLPRPQTLVTTLPNGLRVATEETYGQVSAIGAFLDAGSAHENEDEVGVCHFLETLAFQSTANYTSDDILYSCQRNGIVTAAHNSRESLVYRVDTLRGAVDEAIRLLADAVLAPKLMEQEVEEAKKTIEYQHIDINDNPQMLIQERLHTAAYGANTPLGRSLVCPADRVHAMTPQILNGFRDRVLRPENIVVAAAGVEHDLFVRQVETAFGQYFANTSTTQQESTKSSRLAQQSYVGTFYNEKVIQSTGEPWEHAHTAIAFPTVGWTDRRVVPVCVLDTLLGGGSAFSAGGPGKGMYSRLYREVLNQYAWVECLNAFSLQYADQGLFGLYGSVQPRAMTTLLQVMAHHLYRVANEPVSQVELDRAKNQLRSSVMMNLETRQVLCEDIGRQVLVLGHRLDPVELCERIDLVTAEDLQSVAYDAIRGGTPSIALLHDGSLNLDVSGINEFFANSHFQKPGTSQTTSQ